MFRLVIGKCTSYIVNISSNGSTSASCAIGTRNTASGMSAMMEFVLNSSYNTVGVCGWPTNLHDIRYTYKALVNVRSSGGIYLRIAKSSGNLIYSISVDGHSFDVMLYRHRF